MDRAKAWPPSRLVPPDSASSVEGFAGRNKSDDCLMAITVARVPRRESVGGNRMGSPTGPTCGAAAPSDSGSCRRRCRRRGVGRRGWAAGMLGGGTRFLSSGTRVRPGGTAAGTALRRRGDDGGAHSRGRRSRSIHRRSERVPAFATRAQPRTGIHAGVDDCDLYPVAGRVPPGLRNVQHVSGSGSVTSGRGDATAPRQRPAWRIAGSGPGGPSPGTMAGSIFGGDRQSCRRIDPDNKQGPQSPRPPSGDALDAIEPVNW